MQCNARTPGLPSSSPGFDNFSCRHINRPIHRRDRSFSLRPLRLVRTLTPLPKKKEKRNNKTPIFDFSRVGSTGPSLIINTWRRRIKKKKENRKQNKAIKLNPMLLRIRTLPYFMVPFFIYFRSFPDRYSKWLYYQNFTIRLLFCIVFPLLSTIPLTNNQHFCNSKFFFPSINFFNYRNSK